MIFFIFFLVYFLLSCSYYHSGYEFSYPDIKLFYTEPPIDKKIYVKISELIDSAKESVYSAFYTIDEEHIIDSIISAKDRGLDVKLVGNYASISSEGYKTLLEKIGQENMVVGNYYGIMHNKFIIIDHEIVVTGTGNFTKSGFLYNDNNFVIIKSSEIASFYEEEFMKMYDGYFGDDKVGGGEKKESLVDGIKIEVYFFPDDSELAISRIISLIKLAKYGVYFMIFEFTDDDIADAFIEVANKGVKVLGVVDEGAITGIGEEAPRLYQQSKLIPFLRIKEDGNKNRVYTPFYSYGGRLHTKTLIIDPFSLDAVLITGSFNWSANAKNNNDENIVIIHSPHIAQIAYKQFERCWNLGKTPTRIDE
jgi:phosphatidylserine/phosphatidylglycerophosphate/cardiolipin synthase-like enzyme